MGAKAPYLCQPHKSGVPLGCPPFFNEGCAKCEEKKAAGLVTGNEGPLAPDWARRRNRPGMSKGPRPLAPFKR